MPLDQPSNVDPFVAAAVKVILVLWVNDVEHVASQLMFAGADVTDPVPVPFFDTVSCTCTGCPVEVPLV